MSETGSSRTGSDTWKSLLRATLPLIDDLPRRGFSPPAWTLGGGTALMLRHHHRLSRDIDIFLRDPQYLPALSPRLNDRSASLTADYAESATTLRLVLPEGGVGFIVAPSLTDVPPVVLPFEGRELLLEASAEILAKKLLYRAESLRLRDVLDLAVVLDREPSVAGPLRSVAGARLAELRRTVARLAALPVARLRSEVDLLPAGEPYVLGWPTRILPFLDG